VRNLAVVLGAVLALASVVAATTPLAMADAPARPAATASATRARDAPTVAAPTDPTAPRSGTVEEADEYARREAASPEAQEFEGGFIVFLLVVTVLVLLIVLLARQL
jgi:cobalamin biosynthesis Mg chelatase CobN